MKGLFRAIRTSLTSWNTYNTLDTTRYVFVFTKKKNLRDRKRTCFSLFSTILYITK